MTTASRRVPSAPGSREPSPDGLGPSGFDPSRVPHPSVFIREEREERGWSLVKLACAMGGDEMQENLLALRMYEDVGPTAPGLRIGQHTADQLEKAFGVSAAFFLALEDAWLRDRDRSGEAGETGTGSTEGKSPGPQGHRPHDPDCGLLFEDGTEECTCQPATHIPSDINDMTARTATSPATPPQDKDA